MGVISSLPECRVVFFLDSQDRNVIREWLIEQNAPQSDFAAFQSLLDICEAGGLYAVSSCTVELEDGFQALLVKNKGGISPALVFCKGPFNDTEITFLAGARMENKKIKPRYVAGIAAENLEALRSEPWRKRRERIYRRDQTDIGR